MSAAWVGGGVRARALLTRRIGHAGARGLAATASLPEAVRALTRTAYRHSVRADHGLVEAEYAVGAGLLWNLRVLAGWQPPAGTDLIRLLAGWFEIANTDGRLRELHGQAGAPPYRLGALSTAWPRLAAATSPAELRRVLAASPWGDPGGSPPRAVGLGMRLSWARRIAACVPEAAAWAGGAVALLAARETFLVGPLDDATARCAARVIGPQAVRAGSFQEYARRLPGTARWALSGVDSPEELWRAEPRWWARVERDSAALLARSRFGSGPVLATVALLAVDARRTVAALELAARGGAPLEAFDALA